MGREEPLTKEAEKELLDRIFAGVEKYPYEGLTKALVEDGLTGIIETSNHEGRRWYRASLTVEGEPLSAEGPGIDPVLEKISEQYHRGKRGEHLLYGERKSGHENVGVWVQCAGPVRMSANNGLIVLEALRGEEVIKSTSSSTFEKAYGKLDRITEEK